MKTTIDVVTEHYESSTVEFESEEAAMTRTQIALELPQLEGVQHHFVDLPGLRMHVAEAGSGEPVLLLHGFAQHWWEWRGVIGGLAERYRVICPDLRGQGWTDAPGGGYTRSQLVADLVALLDTFGLDRTRLISHDMGAISGFALALEHPDRVDRHVAIGVPTPYVSFSLRFLGIMRYLWFQEALAMPRLGTRLLSSGNQRLPRWLFSHFTPVPGSWPAEDVELYIAPLRDHDHARAGEMLYRHLVMPEFARILTGAYKNTRMSTPTLLLAGAADHVFEPALAATFLDAAAAHSDHVELEIIDGAGHFVVDEQPQQVLNHALRFFAAR
jgi:pimeloyl-ACP methyl ester carboxylesterase